MNNTDPREFVRDINMAIGVNGQTGKPLKWGIGRREETEYSLLLKLREQDKDINVNMWDWSNTQLDLTSQDINRLLYYRGQLAFAYIEEIEEFVLLPFTVDGNLDMYGRAKEIRLIPFTPSTKDKRMKPVEDFLANKKFRVVNTIKDIVTVDDLTKSAVILYDRTPDLGENVIPQNIMNQALINYEAEIYAFMRTNMINASGVTGVRVHGKDEASNVRDANDELVFAAKHAQKYVPIVGETVDFQELVTSNGNTQEFLQAAQAIHNLRMSLNGLASGGVYDKSQYVNNKQTTLNQGEVDASLVLQDKYARRDEFCNIVNSIWMLGIDCMPSENIIQMDLDQNGVIFDDKTDNHNMEVNDNVENSTE